MTAAETGLLWAAIVSYALSSAAFIAGVFFRRPTLGTVAFWAATAGATVHGISLTIRWFRIGHGPAIGFFEVASGLALLGVLAFIALSALHRGLRVAGVAAMPVALLLMGAILLVNPEAREASGALVSVWLTIHVLFANLAFGCYAAAFILAVAYLMRDSGREGRWRASLDKLPPQVELDGLTFRIVAAGFLFQGVMLASGAVWANEAWGRYWAWDPMETWSLLAWAVYAIYLHLTLTLGWKGRRAAWVLVLALFVILFSLLGVPVFYNSIHGAYLST